ncbi:MAG: methyltransferase domain-containing protein [Methylococcaceae bacterium]|jgi:SAM-dependent methyltransferase
MSPRLSILFFNFNQAFAVDPAVSSVLDQCGPELEVLVVDRGSKDQSAEVLRRLSDRDRRVRWWPDTQALADCLERALQDVTGSIIGILQADTALQPAALEKVLALFAEQHDCLLIGDQQGFRASVSARQQSWSSVFFRSYVVAMLGGGARLSGFDALQVLPRERLCLLDAPLTTPLSPFPAADAGAPQVAESVSAHDLIERYSVSEHVAWADAYFTGREDHAYLYQKPFYHPQNCAAGVTSLGQLLSGLKLTAGMRVLEFAAGSCWLSRILVQLGCVVTSCDASSQALAIGRQLFERYPPILASGSLSEFVVFDGETLAFADNTFDRIIVNDAFHHIPNTAAVLSEFSRVLKPDGMAGMCEPGRYHSMTEDSQFEMRTYNVIENDFVLEDIWAEARAAGFMDIAIMPVLRGPVMRMAEYLACVKGEVPAFITNAVIHDTTNHSIFFLYKQDQSLLADSALPVQIYEPLDFDDPYYLVMNPDVNAAVVSGHYASGWEHYDRYGRVERRAARVSRKQP